MNRRANPLLIAVAALATLLAAETTRADVTEFKGSSASNSEQKDCPTRAKNFEPFALTWLVDGLPGIPGDERGIRCVTEVRNEGKGRKGVKVTLDAEIVDLNGNTVQDLGRVSAKTGSNGYREFSLPIGAQVPANFAVAVDGDLSTRKRIENHTTNCTAFRRKPCVPDATTLCLLNDNRFKVELDWRSTNDSGTAMVLGSGFDTGSFYFFDPGQQELLVQLLNACGNNDHFWVFYQGATSFEFELTVTDTETGEIREYNNPLGQPARAITDTSAFATCP